MSYQDRLSTPAPARDDPGPGDTVTPGPIDPGPTGSGEAPGTERAREAAAVGRDRAQEVAQTATEQARDVASTATGEARNVARTAQGQARRLAHDTRDELRTQADSQVERLASGLGQLSDQLRSMGERGDAGPVTELVGEAAARTQQVADRLRHGGFEDTVSSLKRFGRNRPGLFLLGAFGVGLAAGRVVRNLAEDPSDSSHGVDARGSGNGHGLGAGGVAAPAGSTGDVVVDPYGAPATYTEPYGSPGTASGQAPVTPGTPGTAPVGDERWGT